MRLSSLLVASLFERLRATERRGGGPGSTRPLLSSSSSSSSSHHAQKRWRTLFEGGAEERGSKPVSFAPRPPGAHVPLHFSPIQHTSARKAKKSLRHGAMRLFVKLRAEAEEAKRYYFMLRLAAIPSPVQKKKRMPSFFSR